MHKGQQWVAFINVDYFSNLFVGPFSGMNVAKFSHFDLYFDLYLLTTTQKPQNLLAPQLAWTWAAGSCDVEI